jgi:hypothetical protein
MSGMHQDRADQGRLAPQRPDRAASARGIPARARPARARDPGLDVLDRWRLRTLNCPSAGGAQWQSAHARIIPSRKSSSRRRTRCGAHRRADRARRRRETPDDTGAVLLHQPTATACARCCTTRAPDHAGRCLNGRLTRRRCGWPDEGRRGRRSLRTGPVNGFDITPNAHRNHAALDRLRKDDRPRDLAAVRVERPAMPTRRKRLMFSTKATVSDCFGRWAAPICREGARLAAQRLRPGLARPY